MKHLFIILTAIALLSLQACENQTGNSTNKTSNTANTNANSNAHFGGPVEWISFEQLEEKMKNEPRKVVVDLYTDWCGWCKRMDQSTFANPDLAKYLNEKFYAVKFNAEIKTPVQFKGQTYETQTNGKRGTNALTYKLILGDQTNGRVGYPTFAFLDESLNRIDAFPGYKDAPTFDALSHFIAENQYKNSNFEQFKQTYKSNIAAAAAPSNLNKKH